MILTAINLSLGKKVDRRMSIYSRIIPKLKNRLRFPGKFKFQSTYESSNMSTFLKSDTLLRKHIRPEMSLNSFIIML